MSPAEITSARDWWLRGMLGAATLWLTWAEPIFAPIALWFLCRWRSHAELGPLVAWGAVAAGWFAVRSVPRGTLELVPPAWVGWALVTVAILVVQHYRLGPDATRAPSGTFGQRTFAAAYLALCLPFAPWGLWPALGLGLWLTGPSWGAVTALAVGLPVLAGQAAALGALTTALGVVVLAFVGPTLTRISPDDRTAFRWLLDRTPRGSSLDTLWSRWHSLRLCWRHRREALPWGAGPDSMWQILLRLEGAYKRNQEPRLVRGDLHNDPAQLVWEYGLAGLAVVLIAAYRIGSGLTWGDPWSAAAVSAGVLSVTSLPLRIPAIGLVCLVVWARVAP